MASRTNSLRLTKRIVDAAPAEAKVYIIWDADLPGFGLRIQPSGAKTFIASYRIGTGRGAKQRRVNIATTKAMSCEMARREAQTYIASARLGVDKREEIETHENDTGDVTVADAIGIWREEAATRNRRTGKPRKAKNVQSDIARLEAHVVKLIGKRKIASLTKRDVEKLRDDITEGKSACVVKTKKHGVRRVTGGAGTATRTMRTFKSVLAYMKDKHLVEENVALGVKLQPDGQSERYLTLEEASAIGNRIDAWEQAGRRLTGLRIVKLLILTGARTAEIEELKWSEIDFDRSFFRFDETKSGRSNRPISPEALRILRGLPKRHPELVFPNKFGTGPYSGTQGVWRDLRNEAGLGDVRKHDLRHSFASFGLSSGLSLPIIGALLGHLRPETTQRYAHLSDARALEAAKSVADLLAMAVTGEN